METTTSTLVQAPPEPALPLEDRLRVIIRNEFDLEMGLKIQEVRDIDEEIAKIENCLQHMKLYYESKPVEDENSWAQTRVPEFIDFYAQFLVDPHKKPPPPAAPHSRKRQYSFHTSTQGAKVLRSHSFSSSPSTGQSDRPYRLRARAEPVNTICIARRSDGLTVKLVCPSCERENFANALGFVNHCRLAHAIDFASVEHAADECGVDEGDEESYGESTRTKKKKGKVRLEVPITIDPPKNVKGKTLPGAHTSIQHSIFDIIAEEGQEDEPKRRTRETFLGRIESDSEYEDEDEDVEMKDIDTLDINEKEVGGKINTKIEISDIQPQPSNDLVEEPQQNFSKPVHKLKKEPVPKSKAETLAKFMSFGRFA